MCIVVLYLGEESKDTYQVLLAANRDEAYSRPTSKIQYFQGTLRGCVPLETKKEQGFLSPKPSINAAASQYDDKYDTEMRRIALGRRDEALGDDGMPLAGSQFLVGSDRRWAILTNGTGPYTTDTCSNKDERRKQDDAPRKDSSTSMNHKVKFKRRPEHKTQQTTTSRGQIIPSFINSNCTPEQFITSLEQCPSKGISFEGYNLLLGIGNHAYHVTNKPTFAWERLETGRVYGVSNGVLDEERGKVVKLKSLFEPIVMDLQKRRREEVKRCVGSGSITSFVTCIFLVSFFYIIVS